MESVCGREPWPEYLATEQSRDWVKLGQPSHTEQSKIYSSGRGLLTMCPSLAATKHTRPPLKNVPFSEPKADSAAATDMIQPQLPNTLFLWKKVQVLTKAASFPTFKSHLLQVESISWGLSTFLSTVQKVISDF